MRWFCVAPDLPAKASLRIRAAPSGDADVRGRFSKGKAVAALSDVFQIAADDESDGPQHWLHVTFPEETSGEWIEGFVMTQLPNGMTLLVPWEDAGFYSCCNITSDRAIVYEGPEPTAQAVGYVGEGEGTRFPYGIREVDGHRLRIFHDVHERVWVNAADVEPVCERLEHPKCSVPHSFFALNDELPLEAQIAVRVFPSREAETRALLNRGQVIEVEMRCGSWLKIAGNPESWIMWRTDTWQLLMELPHHSSSACVLPNDADMGGEDLQDESMSTEGAPPQSGTDNQGMEVNDGREGSPTLNDTTLNQELSSDHELGTRKNSSSVTSLCDGLASHDISGHEESLSVDELASTKNEVAVEDRSAVQLPWDERPLNVKSHAQPDPDKTEEESEKLNQESASWEDRPISAPRRAYDWEDRPLNVKSEDKSGDVDVEDTRRDVAAENGTITAAKSTPASSSWEDRPISSSRGAYDWEDRPLNVKTRAQSDHMDVEDTTVQEPEEVANVPVETVEPPSTSSSWEDRPISSSRGAYDWEDRPLNVKTRAQSDHMDVEDTTVQEPEEVANVPVETVEPPSTSSSWEDRPISSSRGAYDWEDRPLNVKTRAQSDHMDVEDTTVQEPEEVANVPVETVEPPSTSSSWEDRPISSSRGAYDWEDRPLNVKTRAQSDHMDVEDTTVQEPEEVANVPVETVEPPSTSSSWEDRPISSSRGAYDWEDRPLNVKTRAQSDHMDVEDTTVQEPEEVANVPVETVEPPSTSSSWEDRPISSSRGTYDREDRPLNVKADDQGESKAECTDTRPANTPAEGSSPTVEEANPALSQENSALLSGRAVAQDGETEGEQAAEREKKDWYWEEAPIKSRHARKAALESETPVDSHAASTTVQVSNGDDVAAAWANAHQSWSTGRRSTVNHEGQAQVSQSATATDESPSKHGAVGVVSAEGTSVAWHSVDPAEEPGAFEDSKGITTQASATFTEAKKISPAKRSPNQKSHTPVAAVGVVSDDTNSVTWHSNDAAEDPGVFDDHVGDEFKVVYANATESITEDEADVRPSVERVSVSCRRGDEQARVEGDDQESISHPELDNSCKSKLNISLHTTQTHDPEAMELEDDDSAFSDHPLSTDDEYSTNVPLLCGTDDEADIYGGIVVDNEKVPVLEEDNSAVPIDWRDYSARLKVICERESRNHLKVSRILRAIALDEGADAILEALATTGEFDEELLRYEAPPTMGMHIAPSPSTSESALLDVLYSRDQEDGFSTPKKRSQGQVKATQSSPYTSKTQSKEERLADILRRTPQKATESHSKIINNAKPEDILEAEFGGCSDELGLFGDYRYPTVSTARFSTGILGSSTRTASAFGSLQSPSFTSSSFNSPPPKENPLKRSAAAIAKTPPVMLPKSVTSSTPAMPPAPKAVVQVPTPTPVQVPTPSMPPPPPVRTKTTPSSLLPPSARAATGLPRPSLMSPSALTSRLRAPSATGATNPTPTVSRARSFTTNSDTRTTVTGPPPVPSKAAPVSGLARTQSMLPRKSALQAPSPVKFGITRTNSLTSSAAPPTAAEAPVDPRRLSFGFSRPSLTKKQ